jgi:serine/threonine protein kinase
MFTIQDQPPDDFDQRLGKRLGKHMLVGRIADGTTSRVYEARHPQTRERVAVKVLRGDMVHNRVALERFKREYEVTWKLNNPYIVRVIDFGRSIDGAAFLTMEYLQGRELSQAIAESALPMSRVVRTMAQIALALDQAHACGFIHRDLKPENIYLCDTRHGTQVRVLDFGAVKRLSESGSKLTAAGTTLGSPCYMAPEQAKGMQGVDQRTDVFALGAILYEMLTGKIAFEGVSVGATILKILEFTPPPPSTLNPSIGREVDTVVFRALRKEPDERYGTVLQLADALIAACGLSLTCELAATKPELEIELQIAATRKAKSSGSSSTRNTTNRVVVTTGRYLQLTAKSLTMPSLARPRDDNTPVSPGVRTVAMSVEDPEPTSGNNQAVWWVASAAVIALVVVGLWIFT